MPDSMLLPVPALQLSASGPARLGESGTIIVPTVLLHVSLHGSIRAPLSTVRTNTVVTVAYAVIGLEKSVLEEVAQVAQGELIARLRRSGLSVSGYEAVADRPEVARLARLAVDTAYGAPVIHDEASRTTYAVIAPSDTQAIGWQGKDQRSRLTALARQMGATVVIPELWFQAPQLQRFVGLTLDGTITGASISSNMDLLRASLRFVTPSGDTGSISLNEPLTDIALAVGEVTLVEADTTALITTLTGMIQKAERARGDTANADRPRSRPARNWTTRNQFEVAILLGVYSRAVMRGASSFFQGVAVTVRR